MKKKFLLTLMVMVLSTIALGTVSVFAATEYVFDVENLQTIHPYSTYTTSTQIYTHPFSAESLDITFSSDTETYSGYSSIYIYDGEGKRIGVYSGKSLANKTINVPGRTVQIMITNDSRQYKYGYRVTNIKANISSGSIDCLEVYKKTKHSTTLAFPLPSDATDVKLEVSEDGESWTTNVTQPDLTSNFVTINNLSQNKKYYFRLNVTGGINAGISNVVDGSIDCPSPEWQFVCSNGVITQYVGNDSYVVIPASIKGAETIGIGDSAFEDKVDLSYIVIPDSVTSVGSDAFTNTAYYNNSSNWSNNVLYIGNHLIDTKYGLQGDYFIKENTKTIADYAFALRDITSVTIPKSVITIGGSAFWGCDNLARVDISDMVAWCNIEFMDNFEANPLCNSSSLYLNGTPVTNLVLSDDIVEINNYAFYGCSSLSTLEIPVSMTKIGESVFKNCSSLSKVCYNGNQSDWDKISIGLNNDSLENATKDFYHYLTLIDIEGNELATKRTSSNTIADISDIPERKGHSTHLYKDKDCLSEFDINTPIVENLVLYFNYTINKYVSKFIDYDGNLIQEIVSDYGTVITLPENPIRNRTQQYTYMFAGWDGYSSGLIQEDREMVFTAKYNEIINQYTYKFLDEDGSVLKEETVDYGTTITPPSNPIKTEYYLFDYWQGYTEGITLTDDITFTAVYKYKDYTITAEGLSDAIVVTYNSEYMIDRQTKELYHFVGYFTEKDGAGIQITNEKGESLNVYNVVGDLKVYPYFESVYMNKLEMQGTASAMPGDIINQRAIFATDKNATYFIATVKYPKHLNFRSIKGVDFKEATKDSERVVGDYKYLDITCVFDYEGNFAEINKNHVPFEIEFDVATDAPVGACVISIENVMLIGDDTFEITDIKNHTLTILPKLAESIEIIGSTEIDKATQFTTVVSPDYTTDKSVVWSVDDETVATITQDGTVTPVKNGTVIITATAKDGSEVFATKSVNVIAYAKINSLDFGGGVVLTEFNPDIRKYTVYVKENATSISLTPTFSGGGVLRPNGSGVWVSGRPKDFDLNDTATTITLNRENVTDMTNSVYTIEVIKFEGTKTKVSEDKKSFTIKPINIENGKTVILALYNGEQFVEMQSAVYTSEAIHFTTTKTYTKAKVMVWNDITNLKPVCNVEELN